MYYETWQPTVADPEKVKDFLSICSTRWKLHVVLDVISYMISTVLRVAQVRQSNIPVFIYDAGSVCFMEVSM